MVRRAKFVGKVVKATPLPELNQVFSSELLAKAITAQRTAMKLRIVDVAKALSLSKQTIVKIEKGETKVHFANVLMVMEYLGLSFQITVDKHLPTQQNVTQDDSDDCWF